MYKTLLKILIWTHNLSYRLIGYFSIKDNGGIHPKHRILNYYDFFVSNLSNADKVLDIGCGNGACINAVSKKVSRAVGIDICAKNIKLARKKFPANNLKYIIGDATTYEFKENFDAVILSNVLEHIQDRANFLEKIKKLAPKLLVRVPLITRDWLSVYKKEIGLEYRLDNTHFTEYTEEDFKSEIEKSGLVLESYYIKFGELYAVLKTK